MDDLGAWAGALALVLCAGCACGQLKIVEDPGARVGAPQQRIAEPSPSPERELMTAARRLLASNQPRRAYSMLDDFIDRRKGTDEPYLAEAYYLRGNAQLALGNEYDALFDYEEVIQNRPESEFFAPCLEKELEVAKLYLNGLRRPSFIGIRIDSGESLAEEIIIRIVERLPGSRLSEQALLELADFYARTRDLKMASEAYDVFLRLYPRSAMTRLAMQRRVYANIAQFKGPGYDTRCLRDALVQIDDFQEEFPAEAQATGVSDALAARVDESIAAGLLQSARWYLKRDDAPSARLTLSRLIKRHPRTGAAQEAARLIQQIDQERAS